MNSRRVVLPAALGAAIVSGCSSGTNSGPLDAGQVADGDLSCTNDPSVDPGLGSAVPFALPVTKAGMSGALSFVIVEPLSSNPPTKGTSTWTFKVLDGSGNPATTAVVSIPRNPLKGPMPWMPIMQHGSIPAQAKPNGDGTFTIPMYFNMPGVWQITLDAQYGSVMDSATFTWCVL